MTFPGSVEHAIHARRSVRAFTDRPVPGDVLRAMLSAALRSPSGGNVQPWHIHVLTGAALDRLVERIRAQASSGEQQAPAHPVYPESLWDPFRTRRFANGEDLYRAIAIDRSDKAGRLRQVAKNFEFFGAPVGLIFVVDRRMGKPQWIDLGILMQSLMLIAVEHGLATCPQAAWALWPDTLREQLALDEMTTVAAGMALGYEDRAHPINELRTPRQSLAEGVTFHA